MAHIYASENEAMLLSDNSLRFSGTSYYLNQCSFILIAPCLPCLNSFNILRIIGIIRLEMEKHMQTCNFPGVREATMK